MFKVVCSYPDGHLEEIEQDFFTLDEAKEYGFGLLAQVAATERYMGKSYIDDFGEKTDPQEPFFIVIKREGKKNKNVFISLR